jgi:lipopolysaccharide export system permease protein
MSKVGFAPFGRHTRYMLAGYLRHVLIVTSILLAIALTIDLWPQYQMVAESGGPGALAGIWVIARFCALRTPGLVAPFLPFAAFVGVLWTEVVHTQSGERMLVWNSGRSPAQCLVPVLLLGLILGIGEFAMDGYLGPASMGIQMHERLGRDGQRLDRSRIGKPSWIAVSGGLLRTEIEYGPPAVLHDLTFFKRDSSGHLIAVVTAAVARRQAGTDLWLMRDGLSWKAAGPLIRRSDRMTPFAAQTIRLDLDPVLLTYFGMEPQYLPLPVLRHLARIDTGAGAKGYYRTRLEAVFAEPFLPGGMALLASALSLLLLAYATPAAAVVAIVFCGYFAHFAAKACLLLGQNDYMAAVTAGWLVPGLLAATTLIVMGMIEWQRRRSGPAPRTMQPTQPLNAG